MTLGEGIKPSFDLLSGLMPLNEIQNFPVEMQPKVIEGLERALAIIPTVEQYDLARQCGDTGEWLMEKLYGAAAGLFGASIDERYDPNKAAFDNPTETTRLVQMFYRMIRTLTADQIKQGLEELRQLAER